MFDIFAEKKDQNDESILQKVADLFMNLMTIFAD